VLIDGEIASKRADSSAVAGRGGRLARSGGLCFEAARAPASFDLVLGDHGANHWQIEDLTALGGEDLRRREIGAAPLTEIRRVEEYDVGVVDLSEVVPL